MTTNDACSEEAKTVTASIDDPVETHHELKPSVEVKKGAKDSDSDPVAADRGNDIFEATVESETTSETSDAQKITAGEETKEQVPEETAEQTNKSSESSSHVKSNKKQVNPSNAIKNPNVHDVLLGRGKPFQNHDGNQNMLRIVDMYRRRYHESERAFKHEIIEEVLDIIKSKGGRFLERIDDFEKSFWNQVPHRMAYRKVGHAFRSNARRISMEKRDQAHNQRRNASAMARASMMSQFITGNNNEGMIQRMPIQGVSLPEMMPVGGTMGLADTMGMGGSVYNDSGGINPGMYRQGGGTSLNQTQRELLAQEQMLHSSRIERILGNNSNSLNRAGAGSASPHRFEAHSMLNAGDSLPFAMGAGGNLAGRSLQINNMRRMMLLGSGGVPNHPSAYHFTNSGTAAGSRIPNISLSNMGNVGDSAYK